MDRRWALFISLAICILLVRDFFSRPQPRDTLQQDTLLTLQRFLEREQEKDRQAERNIGKALDSVAESLRLISEGQARQNERDKQTKQVLREIQQTNDELRRELGTVRSDPPADSGDSGEP